MCTEGSRASEQQQQQWDSEFLDVKRLVWGTEIKDDLFRRWSQGFIFSSEEPTALVQLEGGPCAVIAPLQAFILKYILTDSTVLQDNRWRRLPRESADGYLVKAMSEILRQAKSDNVSPSPLLPSSDLTKSHKTSVVRENGSPGLEISPVISSDSFSLVFLNEPVCQRRLSDEESTRHLLSQAEQDNFHRNLHLLHLKNQSSLEQVLTQKVEALKGNYGILLFLYSVVLTKGIEKLSSEMSEATELIDPEYGHGNQSLINLMLTGRGVNYVWDNEQDVGGLKLQGIVQPSEIGFLTLLERLRYCEVGSFLKNPKFPIWVVGSETHLTVLFSTNMNLVCPETAGEKGERLFHSFDPEGNNFISALLLEDLMKSLDLFSDSEYVEVIKCRLDPEMLGIILLNDFLEEFFPNDRNDRPETFLLYHYNGLPHSSSHRKKVIYLEGNAILLETNLRSLSDENKILTCLQTKWPSIDVTWNSGTYPSIN